MFKGVNIKIFCFFSMLFLLMNVVYSQQVTLTSPSNGAQFTLPVSIPLEAAVTGVPFPEPAYMYVQNSLTGYRKLKFGYSPTSLYSPLQNVVAGGNTHLQITMKVISGNMDWNKILIRPMGLGSLSLQPYVAAAGGVGNTWKVVTIPLSDFITTINFTQIANIEFPYSSNAPSFELAIASIKFTGGTNPFNWFGEGKTDNLHNGNGGNGELFARLTNATYPSNYPKKVEFYAGSSLLAVDSILPYQGTWTNPSAGSHSLQAKLYMSDDIIYSSAVNTIEVNQPQAPSYAISITQPLNGDTLLPPASFLLMAEASGITSPPPDHLLVSNPFTGYRKLKIGYSPTSLYSPLMNVLTGGNNAIEITLRDVNGGTDWSRIQLRPAGIGSLCVLPYVQAAGGIGSGWTTIVIPLSHFSASINFAALNNIEFPFSASANNFTIAVKSIRFIGGSQPFVWFGYGKSNNKHNGNGGSGELLASLIQGNASGTYIDHVEFWSGTTKLGDDADEPFQMNVTGLPEGSYTFTARMIVSNGTSVVSDPVTLAVYEPVVLNSSMSVSVTSPSPASSYLAPLNLPVSVSFSGAVPPGEDYLKVTNTLTGFVKLKLGYAAGSIYSPKQNVVAGGNDTMEIVIRNIGNPVDWSKIRVRPAGIGYVNLGSYGGVGYDWTTIRIPLSAFDTAIDFTSIAYMEFPFSAGANSFQVAVQSIRFTGGTTPFVWFGSGKTDNAHDGDGAAGHMTAEVFSPSAQAVQVAGVELFANGTKVSEDFSEPFTLVYPTPSPGIHSIYVKMTDNKGRIAYSDTIGFSVISQVPEGHLLVTVGFDQVPSSLSVKKAPLRYDKDFAYSLSLDDGLRDAYTCAFKLMNGGFSNATGETYPGLFYTDGCGNNIPFKGSLVWNSVSSSFVDIHLNTPGYVTWTELNEMLDAGWGVINHGFSHANGAGTNYAYEITANDSAVFANTGRHMNHFVTPSGDVGFMPYAWQKGIVCSYSRTTPNGSPYGLKVDDPLNLYQFNIYRNYKSDDLVNYSNITFDLDNCAALSQNGNHYWYNDFTHHVSPDQYGGSLLFPLFRSYMEYAAAQYGAGGSDRIWAAPGPEVFEYIKLRDALPMTWSHFGNQLRILINRDNMPDDLETYALSLAIEADANITSVTLNDNAQLTWRGNTPKKLINLSWESPTVQSQVWGTAGVAQASPEGRNDDHLDILSPEGMNDVRLHIHDKSPISGSITVYDITGKRVWQEKRVFSDPDGYLRLNIPGLKRGLYLFNYVGDDGRNLSGKWYQPQ